MLSVRHEVHRPALAAAHGCRQRHAVRAGQPFAAASTHLQTGLAVHAMHALVVGHQPFAGHQDVQAAITVPRADGRMRLQALQQSDVVGTSATSIPPRGRADADHATRAP
jgi:hypothetical protein